MRILFAGTPEIALFSLDSLESAGFMPCAVLTAPDKPRGRRGTPVPSPVKEWAASRGVAVEQPVRLDGAAREAVGRHTADILVTVAYGRIFGPQFLGLFPRGGVNLHPSLLPRHRGPSPIQAAILAGDGTTGVTIQRIAREMDAGDILAQESLALNGTETAAHLHDVLGLRGAALLVDVVRRLEGGEIPGVAQRQEDATWCSLITRDDGGLTWRESAATICRMVRALSPWPGVRCRWNGREVHLTEVQEYRGELPGTPPAGTVAGVDRSHGILVQTADGALCVSRLKLQARREMDYRSFLNGNSTFVGSVLEQA